MSRKRNCLDNAATEGFFGTLKSECFKQQRYTCVEQLRETLDRQSGRSSESGLS
ncbi:integrase [Burkholderia ubonensis]|uniref:Integrase n=1 Tax=Burkholderia ubonensis TaxID=101571 RepID=A0A125JSA1_9BURK|nr:integrase [Burkholderia ubonensis]